MDAEAESYLRDRKLTRDHAIVLLERLNDPEDMDLGEFTDYASMTNEELLAEVCLSGTIHDSLIDAVVDG